jgi:quinol monooxygenase YgiN
MRAGRAGREFPLRRLHPQPRIRRNDLGSCRGILAGMPGEVVMVSRARVRTGEAARLLAEVTRHVSASRAEPGCVEYDLYLSATEFEELAAVGRWESIQAAQAHLAAAHTAAFLARIGHCLADAPRIQLLVPDAAPASEAEEEQRDLARHRAGGERDDGPAHGLPPRGLPAPRRGDAPGARRGGDAEVGGDCGGGSHGRRGT